ncbi:ABC transporter substrate-binding protein (plasmid) [Entomospira entomophila]|uniref:ABC transporter substrate-binding protein n=1 Tax=Entomospira entomophila TaxID=2719988 RepID=A0A968GAG7_9SPIO|nr:ABC transporter substrate-binding protein [Entomospira entomophilus]NIZ41487.1 ABC transporter substrate-binding protein [Entomospira entomophilus]WDI36321.1 ABC transporter substrate-binding protein [Entomospira entomophilus]
MSLRRKEKHKYQEPIIMGIIALMLMVILIVHLEKKRDRSIFRYGMLSEISLDIHHTRNPDIATIYRHIIEPLYVMDDAGQIIPWLTEDLPKISADGRRYHFQLRPNISFHDGTQVSSYDVEFVFTRMFHPKYPSINYELFEAIEGAREMLRGEVNYLSGFKVIDDLNFIIELDYPFALFLSYLTMPHAGIYARQAYLQEPPAWGEEILVGSGPYRVAWADKGDRVALTRFNEYHGDVAVTKQLVFSFYPNVEAIFHAYKQEEIDMMQLPFSYYRKHFREMEFSHLAFVHRVGYTNILFNQDHSPVNNLLIRQAIAHAVDRDRLNQRIYAGLARPVYHFLPDEIVINKNSDPLLPSHDVVRARELVKQAGYPNGVRIVVQYSEEVMDRELWFELADQLKRANIHLVLLQQHPILWRKELSDGQVSMVIGRWIPNIPRLDALLYGVLSSKLNHKWSMNYQNDQVDHWLHEARYTESIRTRESIYRQVEQTAIAKDLALLPILSVPHIFLIQPHISYRPDTHIHLDLTGDLHGNRTEMI